MKMQSRHIKDSYLTKKPYPYMPKLWHVILAVILFTLFMASDWLVDVTLSIFGG